MYKTCIHCFRPFPSNEVVEHMPVGNRLAYDMARGRLWVVCPRCERWNLTPFLERWEAMEDCERLFRATRVRSSSGQMGVAQMRDGTRLIRIGKPLRPEFAAWRYGDQFGRRRRRAIITGSSVMLGVGAVASGAALMGIGAVAVVNAVQFGGSILLAANQARSPVLSLPDGTRFKPVGGARLIADPEDGWGVDVGYTAIRTADDPRPFERWFKAQLRGEQKNELGRISVPGTDALPVLRWLMAQANRAGARSGTISDSVKLLEERSAEAFPTWATQQMRGWAARAHWGDTGSISTMPVAARLALEMAVHEDAERRVLEGELESLERAWAEAEEVAAIADSLLTPSGVTERLRELRQRFRA